MSFAMKCFSIPLVLLIQCAVSVCSENILIIDGFPSPSHQMWTHRLSKAIANHGYNVTLLSPKIINCESLNLHFYHLDTLNGFPKSRLSMGSKTGTWNQFKMYTEYLHYYDVQSVKAKGFLEISNFPVDFLFNVIIYDNLGAKPLLALADRFPDAKLMVASPNPGIDFTNFITKGPRFFSFVPFIQMCDLDGSFVSRSKNFLIYSIGHFLTRYLWLPRSEEIRHSIYPIRRSLEDIYAETNILLVNYDPIFDSAIPILPGVVPVGGLQIEEPIPLSKDLETIFKIPSKGIVYFSIGSNLKSEMLGLKRLRIILDVLGQIPDYTFLWKFEMSNGDLESPKNVFIRNWFPQNDILADNRTKLFISQAGALSMQECTWYGIPMLALPIMFDQFPNAKKAVDSGMALEMDVNTMDTVTFKRTLIEMLSNKKYSEAAKLRSRNFRDQKETPIGRALWWVDYVVRTPDTSFFRNKKLEEMNYFEKHSFDVIGLFSLTLYGVIALVGSSFFFICKKGIVKKRMIFKIGKID